MTDFLTAKANTGAGVDQLAVESVAGGIMPITKIHTGALGVDDGPVTDANPFPIALPPDAATETTLALLKAATDAFNIGQYLIEPFATNTAQVQLGGTAVEGDKIALVPYVDGATKINYVYQIRHSGADFLRMMVI